MGVPERLCMSYSPRLPSCILLSIDLNPQTSQPWDNVTACATGDTPESTGTSRPSFAPKFDDGDAVRVGVIVGVALVCTVLVFVLVGTGGWFVLRRYRRRRRPYSKARSESPSAQHLTADQENGRYTLVARTPDADKRFYVRAQPLVISFCFSVLMSGLPATP